MEHRSGPPPRSRDRDRVTERQRHAAAVLVRADTLELRIEKLVQGGDGLGRVEGVPVLVARTAPGDLVRVRITERHVGWGRAEVEQLLEPGPGRRVPPCPVFDRCGGCDLQHLDDALQTRLKAAAARETLERLGGVLLDSEPTVVAGAAWGYRMRAQWRLEGEGAALRAGYFARHSHDLVPTAACPILEPVLERELAELPERLRGAGVLPRRLDVALGDDGPRYAPVVAGLPHGPLRVTVGAFVYELDARAFFQAHRGLLAALVDEAVGEESGEVAWDLYAGVGLFALPLLRRYRRVVAVESDRVAVRYLRRNLRRAGESEVHDLSVERFLQAAGAPPDRVVVDPPRTGLSSVVVARLRALAPELITYVSCDAATLARDLAAMGSLYRPRRVVFLDLFPQTAHLETVVQLARQP